MRGERTISALMRRRRSWWVWMTALGAAWLVAFILVNLLWAAGYFKVDLILPPTQAAPAWREVRSSRGELGLRYWSATTPTPLEPDGQPPSGVSFSGGGGARWLGLWPEYQVTIRGPAYTVIYRELSVRYSLLWWVTLPGFLWLLWRRWARREMEREHPEQLAARWSTRLSRYRLVTRWIGMTSALLLLAVSVACVESFRRPAWSVTMPSSAGVRLASGAGRVSLIVFSPISVPQGSGSGQSRSQQRHLMWSIRTSQGVVYKGVVGYSYVEVAPSYAVPWLACAAGLAICISRVRRARVLQRLVAIGHCPVCGYDLRATPDRCPECGTVVFSPTQSNR